MTYKHLYSILPAVIRRHHVPWPCDLWVSWLSDPWGVYQRQKFNRFQTYPSSGIWRRV